MIINFKKKKEERVAIYLTADKDHYSNINEQLRNLYSYCGKTEYKYLDFYCEIISEESDDNYVEYDNLLYVLLCEAGYDKIIFPNTGVVIGDSERLLKLIGITAATNCKLIFLDSYVDAIDDATLILQKYINNY